jgi:hypothetical protein
MSVRKSEKSAGQAHYWLGFRPLPHFGPSFVIASAVKRLERVMWIDRLRSVPNQKKEWIF